MRAFLFILVLVTIQNIAKAESMTVDTFTEISMSAESADECHAMYESMELSEELESELYNLCEDRDY